LFFFLKAVQRFIELFQSRLHTAAEIRQWIPSIKKEIDFCLRHLSGIRNYPDYKIKEFQERLAALETEYKRFVAKCKALDPTMPGVPGDPHPYISKRKLAELVSGISPFKSRTLIIGTYQSF
jgi:hypothetical protein